MKLKILKLRELTYIMNRARFFLKMSVIRANFYKKWGENCKGKSLLIQTQIPKCILLEIGRLENTYKSDLVDESKGSEAEKRIQKQIHAEIKQERKETEKKLLMIGHVSDLGENFDTKTCRKVSFVLDYYIKSETSIWQQTLATKLRPNALLEKFTKFLYPSS